MAGLKLENQSSFHPSPREKNFFLNLLWCLLLQALLCIKQPKPDITKTVASVVSDSVQPHRQQPTRLLYPWDFPGKSTGVGCHFLLQCMKVESERKSLSRAWLLVTPRTAAYQAPPSMGFSRQEYWSGVPLPSLTKTVCTSALFRGFPGGSVIEILVQCRRCRFDPWVRQMPWRREWQPSPVFLPGEFHGQRSLVGYSPWGLKKTWTWLRN